MKMILPGEVCHFTGQLSHFKEKNSCKNDAFKIYMLIRKKATGSAYKNIQFHGFRLYQKKEVIALFICKPQINQGFKT